MNRRGQALTESIILLIILTLFSVKFLQLGLHAISEIVVDDLVEEALICKLQNDNACVFQIKRKLLELNYTHLQITDSSYNDVARIAIRWNSSESYVGYLESELKLDLAVP